MISTKHLVIKYKNPINLLKLDFQIDEVLNLQKFTIRFDTRLLRNAPYGLDCQSPLEKFPLLAEASVVFLNVLSPGELSQVRNAGFIPKDF